MPVIDFMNTEESDFEQGESSNLKGDLCQESVEGYENHNYGRNER